MSNVHRLILFFACIRFVQIIFIDELMFLLICNFLDLLNLIIKKLGFIFVLKFLFLFHFL